ncbi:Gamma-glutamyltranspeptidase precursor [Symmachiella dynata]|uniref:Glutathione hydrolase proenzyme n=1 Tax=Symmachiella dynata TaxID=2527995 RepID=A0A517ZW68_9PLAN|nr:gamma-glutamyltransferase [Symmachiella dynata]QDU46747.1 Gamma-glutamyltranspeptidase precursor [Symmachiella dynata]
MSHADKWARTRPTISGLHGAVASAHPLASQAGLDVLRSGGNAVDAIAATAATLAVVEPYMSGPGGVGFLLLHKADGTTRVLNFSGNTPAAGTPDQFTAETQECGPRACLIPGNLAGWLEAVEREGTLKRSDIFAAAIRHAEDGFPLHPTNVHFLKICTPRLNDAGQRVFSSVPHRIGAVLKQPDLANSYRQIVDEGAETFYRGELAGKIAEHIQSQDGLLSREDLANYRPEWEIPIGVDYRGTQVKTCPPNNEGFQILQQLRMLESFDLGEMGHNSADYIQLVSEAIKLAVADRIAYNGDPKLCEIPLERLLSDDYIAERRSLVNRTWASHSEGERWFGPRDETMVSPGRINGMTTHMAAVDEAGNVASITQSLGNGFGSGVMIPGTGIVLNNFVWWCEIDPTCPTPNLIAPGKRWSSCMAPLHAFRDGRFWFSVATPGSWGILQTTMQMFLNVAEFGADLQAAIEAPRFRVWERTRMQIETRIPRAVRDQLTRRHHALEPVGDFSPLVGGGQGVMIDPESGARMAAADPRRDGYALAY